MGDQLAYIRMLIYGESRRSTGEDRTVSIDTHLLKIVDNSPGQELGTVEVQAEDAGEGRPVLLLHGGAGPQSVAGFAESLVRRGFRVVTPTHPGFGGTTRPDGLNSIAQLGSVYSALLERLGLADVTVIGNSIGGWVAAELALQDHERVGRLVLVDATGIEVPRHPVADFFSLSMDEVLKRSFHDPAPFRVDPATMSEEAKAVMGGNREALRAYAGTSMTDPGLATRLLTIAIPTLVVWGDEDEIVDLEYGRAYAAAIPGSVFELMVETGHVPQLESPDQLLELVYNFVGR
jgi:pimeloyl-ACP methyl ester carboxylesterase